MSEAQPPYPLERTHLEKNDLDWLPPELRKTAKRIERAGTAVGVLAVAGFLGLSIYAHFHLMIFLKWPLVGMAAMARGAARRLAEQRLIRKATQPQSFQALRLENDNAMVRVRGRVRASTVLRSVIGAEPCVYCRVVAQNGVSQVSVIQETAVDFFLEDDAGQSIEIRSAGARLLVARPKLKRADRLWERFATLPFPEKVVQKFRNRRWGATLNAGEVLLRDGDLIDVLGFTTRAVDQSVADRGFRETPTRTVLRSGNDLPLLIAPVDEKK